MRSRSRLRLFVALLLLTAGATCLRATVRDRLSGAITDTSAVTLPGHVSPQVKRAVDHGRLNGSTPLTSLSLNFAPSEAQQAALDALLAAQQNPASSSYHQWLTPTQFGQQFGMSATDLAKVTAWLQSRGFTVERVAPSRNAIHFSGTADQVEQSFHTELHMLTVDGQSAFANTTEVSLPSALAAVVSGVGGLNNFHLKPHLRPSAKQVPYTVKSSQAGASALVPFAVDPSSGNDYVAPEDFANIYDVKALYNAGFNGSASYPIAIIGQTQILTADLTDFRTAFGLSTSNLPTQVLMPSTGSSAVTGTDDLSESELDLEWSSAVAPSAPIYFIYTGNASAGGNYTYGVFDALQYVIQTYTVSGKPIPIISLSYGDCETDYGLAASNFTTYENWFKQANAQGQTILNSSGDQGAAGCDYNTTVANNYAATQGLAVSYPASSQYVTGVGGTSFSGDLTSKTTYWSTSNDNNYGNELGLYIPSATWNNTPTTAAATTFTGLSASGGGVSAVFPKPAWQTGVAGIPTDGKRDVPDVALSADPNHDGFLVCINSSCSSGYFNVYGGTSVAAPSFAGILALTEQKLAAVQGNLNPSLYTLAANATKYASAFHDIISGSNIVPCVVSSTDTGCSGGTMGYNATTGYDLVTGLGAPDAANFATALSGIPTLIATSTTLTASTSSPVTGQSVTFTAAVGASSLTTPPTGNVVFTVDGATTGTTVALSGSGSASFATSFTTGGPHTVTATYSGDGYYYGSSAVANLTVTIAPNAANAATATTLTASSSTVAVGSSLTLKANVTSTSPGTLAGTVTFFAGTTTLGTVQLTATGSTGSATLTTTVALATLPVGTDSLMATFNGGGTPTGGGSYAASSSPATQVTVNNPMITLSAPNISIASGAVGTSTVTVTSSGGYAGTVTFTATATSKSLLNYASVLFTPASVTLSSNGTATSTFAISTNSATPALKGGTPIKSTFAMLAVGGGVSFAGLLLFSAGGMRRKRWPSLLLSVLVLAAFTSAMGCGSSSSNTGGGGTGGGSTGTNVPAGTYTVTLVGTDNSNGSITGSVNVTLTLH